MITANLSAQGLTVVAMVIGAYMISNKNEEAKEKRHRALTGELANCPPPLPRLILLSPILDLCSQRWRSHPGQLPQDTSSKPEPAVVTAIKERRPEDTDAAYDHLYPSRAKTKVSDFTRRLRVAEEQQAADDDMAAAAKSNTDAMAAAREDTAAVAAAAAKAKAKEGK